MKRKYVILISIFSTFFTILLLSIFLISINKKKSIFTNTLKEDVVLKIQDLPYAKDLLPDIEFYSSSINTKYAYQSYESSNNNDGSYDSITIHTEFLKEDFFDIKDKIMEHYVFLDEPILVDNHFIFPFVSGEYKKYNFYIVPNMHINMSNEILYNDASVIIYNDEIVISSNSYMLICFNEYDYKINFLYIYSHKSAYNYKNSLIERNYYIKSKQNDIINEMMMKFYWFD